MTAVGAHRAPLQKTSASRADEDRDPDRVRDNCHGGDFGAKQQWVRYVNDRVDSVKDCQKRYDGAGNARDAQPNACISPYRSRPEKRNGKESEINDSVKDIGSVIYQLKCFLNSSTDLAGNTD